MWFIGVGFKDKDDQWTEHESKFGVLLGTLTGDNNSATLEKKSDIKSLEEKSQNSRARVHYRKFTRGKDLSRYSEKDLANIFGKKSLSDSVKKDDKEEDVSDDKIGYNSNSPFLINGGSMIDYFKKKLPNIANKNTEMDNHDSESESECRIGFGFKTPKDAKKSKETFVSYVADASVDESTKLKRKCFADEELPGQPESKKKKTKSPVDDTKKSKKKNKLDNNGEPMGLSNPAFDPLHSNVVVQKHQLNTISENIEEEVADEINDSPKSNTGELETISTNSDNGTDVKRTKKKSNNTFSNTIDDQEMCSNEETPNKTIESNNVHMEESYEVKRKVKKSKRVDNDEVSFQSKKKQKKQEKNENITSAGIYNPALNNVLDESTDKDSFSETIVANNEFEVKRKKKKKSQQSEESFAVENVAFNNVDLDDSVTANDTITNDYEVKRKTKKSKKAKKDTTLNEDQSVASENFALELNESECNETTIESHSSEFEVKRKVKKSKKSKSSKTEQNEGLDNPCLNADNLNREESTGESVSNEFEVVRKSKKQKKTDLKAVGVDNVALNLNDSNPVNVISDISVIESDLMFNIVSTPIIKKNTETSTSSNTIEAAKSSVKRRKSVRFNDVTQEHIIPNKEEVEEIDLPTEIDPQVTLNGSKGKKGRSKKFAGDQVKDKKANFNKRINSISQKIDGCQAEVENDINEAKLKSVQMEDMMIGQVGNPDGENESHEEGSLLKFKYAKFGAVPGYMKNLTGAKKSYKHLIKGDIVVQFKNANLHEINGYATEPVSN